MELVLKYLGIRQKACSFGVVLMKLQNNSVKMNYVYTDIMDFGKPQCQQEDVYNIASVQ